ncbi:MAG: hypothetical protein JWO02_2631 [Solirubrobacterales bacterium]|nr:hypothetical protein [Solirubrobacterales bacterium]
MSDMTNRHGLPTMLAATAATLLLTACGGGSGGDGASAGQPDDAKRLAFAACMRKAGVDVQVQGGSGGAERSTVRVPKGIAPARMEKIQGDCAKKTGGGPKAPSKAEQAKFLDQALKFSRCMRAHGVDLPDPQATGTGGIVMKAGPGGGGIDPSSPAFQRAQKACESFMPGGKGGAPMMKSKAGGGDPVVSAGSEASP